MEEKHSTGGLSDKYEELMKKVGEDPRVQEGKAFFLRNKRDSVFSLLALFGMLCMLMGFRVIGMILLGFCVGFALSAPFCHVFHAVRHLWEKGDWCRVGMAVLLGLAFLWDAPLLMICLLIGIAAHIAWDPDGHKF